MESVWKKCVVGFFAAVIVVGSAVVTPAVEIGGEEIGINLDFTYATKYLWHGYDVLDDEGAFQPSIEFSWRGFYAGAWGSWADSNDDLGGGLTRNDLTEIDLYLGYGYSFFADEQYQIDTSLTYTYFAYPHVNSDGDCQEIAASVSFPNLLPIGPSALVPSIDYYYIWEGVQDSDMIDDGHIITLGLGYDVPITPLFPQQEEQAISLSWDINYNDGTFGSNSDWSHSTFGIGTTFGWKGVYFTPAVYYQWSLDSDPLAVNDEDDFYAMFSVGYSF